MKRRHHIKVLFILKKNFNYDFVSYCRRSSGLFNSTRFIVESLNARGINAAIIEVSDNNDIDREVSKYKPDFVVIEALWVVPSKFTILKRLHPKVKWSVHLHSHMPFLALEGIAMEWIAEYARLGIDLIANSVESYQALRVILDCDKIVYLPNVYMSYPLTKHFHHKKQVLDIGCFGAIRPLKNQLLQALAAIQFAKEKKKFLFFHINGSRVETGGQPVLKNLIQLFKDQHKHARLVLSKWNEPDEFLHYLHKLIDIGMQVSLTETFNVVSADYVTAGVPIVVSKEVKWASCWNKAKDDSLPDIVERMHAVYKSQCLVKRNQKLLLRHSARAQAAWFQYFDKRRVLWFGNTGK